MRDSGFIPPKADLVKKDLELKTILSLFSGGDGWARTIDLHDVNVAL